MVAALRSLPSDGRSPDRAVIYSHRTLTIAADRH
jgi:hypothetical protein